jgi:hypothetical protein
MKVLETLPDDAERVKGFTEKLGKPKHVLFHADERYHIIVMQESCHSK